METQEYVQRFYDKFSGDAVQVFSCMLKFTILRGDYNRCKAKGKTNRAKYWFKKSEKQNKKLTKLIDKKRS